MEKVKVGCLWTIIWTVIVVMCALFWYFKPESEPLFTVKMSRPVPVATPNVFHQVILEQAQTDNQIKLVVAKHELRKEWAWIAAPWVIIGIGAYCFITAWKKWLKISH